MARGLALFLTLFSFCANADIEVRDDLGNTVVLASTAQRVVSLSPHLTEILFELGAGDRVVGTARYSDYPEAAKGIPRVGDAFSVNVESIIALQPDVIFAWSTGGSSKSVSRLKSLGLKVYLNEAPELDQIGRSVIAIATLLGLEESAEAAALDFERELGKLKRTYPIPPKIFFQISDQAIYSVSDEHLIGQAIQHCGGKNIFADLSPSVSMVGQETVLVRKPEAIVMTHIPGTNLPDWYDKWHEYKAFQERIFTIDPNLISRPSFRMLEGVKLMCTIVENAADSKH